VTLFNSYYGPTHPVSESEHSSKYRIPGENFLDVCNRISGALSDSEEHRRSFRMALLHMKFLPAGRIQRAVGSPLGVTPYNCFVSGTIADDSVDIMEKAKEAFLTMRTGGGIGYDFSTLRPRGSMISSFQSEASGAVSFMGIYDATCRTVRSAGGRRGAQMGVLRVDHPDIEEFIAAKQNDTNLTSFNISVAVTDAFMTAVTNGERFPLRHLGRVYKTVDARNLWNALMRATWDWAEPGVLFIDQINRMNNLWYCEQIAATNPCAEQPLPPNGACLLGSFNLTQYVRNGGRPRSFDFEDFKADIPGVVRSMDNIVDYAMYPLPQQEAEAKSKRRMGIGVTGAANAIEALGIAYGSDEYIEVQSDILQALLHESYRASIQIAKEKGPFPLFDRDKFLAGEFVKTLPADIQDGIYKHGIRNSHLTSIAPTGTISLAADNISSGIEPVFAYEQNRTIVNDDGITSRQVQLEDYGVKRFGVKGRTADELSVEEHVDVLCAAQQYVDSAISKTCNVGDTVNFERFKEVYLRAYRGGAKGCTTFRPSGKRFGILKKAESVEEPLACTYDTETGAKSCS
jgi:ribonucleoside-diphosphate reductase alpha chain